MILSLRQIEDIGAAVIQDFNKFFYCGSNALRNNKGRATPIDQFAREYLGLSVRFARLSADGRICGLTSYADAEYIIEEMGVVRTIELKQNQILLDSSFLESGMVKKLCGYLGSLVQLLILRISGQLLQLWQGAAAKIIALLDGEQRGGHNDQQKGDCGIDSFQDGSSFYRLFIGTI